VDSVASTDVSHPHAAPGEDGEHALSLHDDGSWLARVGSDLLEEASASLFDADFVPASQVPVEVVRHFSLGNDHLNLPDILGEVATVDSLLARVTAHQETRTVNGETFDDLVLHVHAGADAMTPVMRTIVFEDFMQMNPEAPDDLQSLLQHILHS
jgi:hypothetical protein